jgi:hypothetical protein
MNLINAIVRKKFDLEDKWKDFLILSCVNRLGNHLKNSNENRLDLSVFDLFHTLIILFPQECEIFISTHKVVELMIQFIKFYDLDTNRYEINQRNNVARILISLSFYKSKSLEGNIEIILNELKKSKKEVKFHLM